MPTQIGYSIRGSSSFDFPFAFPMTGHPSIHFVLLIRASKIVPLTSNIFQRLLEVTKLDEIYCIISPAYSGSTLRCPTSWTRLENLQKQVFIVKEPYSELYGRAKQPCR